jgi:hypothetical protein
MVSVLPAVYRTYSTTTRESFAGKCFAKVRSRRDRLGEGQFVVPPPGQEFSLLPAWSAAAGEDQEHCHHAAPCHRHSSCFIPSARLRSAA